MKALLIITALILSVQKANAECKYSLVEESQKIKWTGYKFTEKSGVSGSFSQINVKSTESDSLKGLLKSIVFEVDTNSVDSGNAARDATLMKTVFAFMSVPQTISGTVTKVDDTTLDVSMVMAKKMGAKFDYTAKDGKILAKGGIDLKENGLIRAFDAVKLACSALHTGEDGVSKTWPDVAIELEASYEEKCSKGIIESIKDWFGSK